jgi:NADH-quinone oxidoreductase subunit J
MLETVLFVILAVFTVVTAVLVIVQRNPVASAIFLILTFFSLAGIYLLLHAEFIAAGQVIV